MNTWLTILFLIIASTATAAVRPIDPIPLTATEKAKDSDRPKARCIDAVTRQRFLVTPDGKLSRVSIFTVYQAC